MRQYVIYIRWMHKRCGPQRWIRWSCFTSPVMDMIRCTLHISNVIFIFILIRSCTQMVTYCRSWVYAGCVFVDTEIQFYNEFRFAATPPTRTSIGLLHPEYEECGCDLLNKFCCCRWDHPMITYVGGMTTYANRYVLYVMSRTIGILLLLPLVLPPIVENLIRVCRATVSETLTWPHPPSALSCE